MANQLAMDKSFVINSLRDAGYSERQITRLLRLDVWRVNFKRVYRIWRKEGLKALVIKVKKRRLGDSGGGILRRRAERTNHVWSMDFIFDRTTNGRPPKVLSIIDEYTRECIALNASRYRLAAS